MENYYDHETGEWVTSWSRYIAIEEQPRYDGLRTLTDPPEVRWRLLLELLAEVPDDVVFHVGCGPLQNFIRAYGAAFVDQLEAAARDNERFRRAVIEVDLPAGALPEAVETRLVAAFGPRFELLPPLSAAELAEYRAPMDG
ncbi:MAG: DUF6869 domain-containing protein [Longimicrobiaceae bacterium]